MTTGASGAWLEERRLSLQAALDSAKERGERNRLGQFATPRGLAVDMLRYARARLAGQAGDGKLCFLDPALGTGAFYSALIEVFPENCLGTAEGYEIDPHYSAPARALWQASGLKVHMEDFTRARAPVKTDRFNLLICNPPYVRHHHLTPVEKQRLKLGARRSCGVDFSGLSGLYCYFLGLGHQWLADGGLAGWLVPSEFMDVNYGASVKRYLLDRVTLLHIHRFEPEDVQFNDALVSSAVVWFRKAPPPPGHRVRFSQGGALERPRLEAVLPAEVLRRTPKWTRYPMQATREDGAGPVLSDFFQIKRGLVTGGNGFFILSGEEIAKRQLPMAMFKPILPSPRYLPGNEIRADDSGVPRLRRPLFLLDCRLDEGTVRERFPRLWSYLQEGVSQGVAGRYLCRRRTPWYAQERRPPALFLCNYMGRGRNGGGNPFRFILNHSQATAANVYLMLYPLASWRGALLARPTLARRVWKTMADITPRDLLAHGRVYGGGLHKLEPKELGDVPAGALARLLRTARPPAPRQGCLLE